jgi:hypothetical protein
MFVSASVKVLNIPVLTVGFKSIHLNFPVSSLLVTGPFNYFTYYVVQSVCINLAGILNPLQFNLLSLAFKFLKFFPHTMVYTRPIHTDL